MAVESKPLFHPEVIRQRLLSFSLPESVGQAQPKLQHWADLISSGKADTFKETALLPDFITDIFCGLLGYVGPANADANGTFTLLRETHVEVDGRSADAALGRFGADAKQFIVALGGGPDVSLRHQFPVRLDRRHLDEGDAALLQRVQPANL